MLARQSLRFALTLFLVWAVPVERSMAASASDTLSASAPPSAVDDQALAPLRRMLESLANARALSARGRVTYDVVQECGQKLQFAETRTVALRRPDRLRATIIRDDGHERHIYYDGSTLTVLDVDRGERLYTRVTAPPTVEDLLPFAAARYGIDMPFADFVMPDAVDRVPAALETGSWIGAHAVAGEPADHLAFRQAELDWQIWIARDEPIRPLKFVVTYKRLPAAPQFSVTFDAWQAPEGLPDATFVFTTAEADIEVPAVPNPPSGRAQ